MKTTLRFLAITFASACLTANVARAFSISAVTLSPSNVVPPMTELRMTIDILTPGQAASLYAPTQISSNASGFRVDVFPTSGLLTAIGLVRETVTLGVFPVGTHHYEVVIHPNFEVNWGTRTNRGTFTVTDETLDRPVVSISGPSTVLEFCPPNADCVGISFSLRRTGPGLDQPLTVFVRYRGTATAAVDYGGLPGEVTFEAGSDLALASSLPIDDTLSEGDETIIAEILPLASYHVDPSRWQATTVIHDNDPVNRPPHLAITLPASGAEFAADTAIEIIVEARDPDGYVRKVEFLADGRKIGEASVEFIRPPDPGQVQTFTFAWRQPPPGTHALTARATDDSGASATSDSVQIEVGMSEPLPIVTVAARDPFAVEPRANTALNTATFSIRRFGPTNDVLVVAYSLHGTADNGVDYETLSGLATIPAGRRSVAVVIRPLEDNLAEGIETVRLRLEQPPPPSPEIRVINPYRVASPHSAVAAISDGPWLPLPGGSQCSALPGGLLHVCFAAEAGYNFRVEASDDLRNWETLFDTAGSDGTWHFIDTDMEMHPRRFYRLAPEPVAEVDE